VREIGSRSSNLQSLPNSAGRNSLRRCCCRLWTRSLRQRWLDDESQSIYLRRGKLKHEVVRIGILPTSWDTSV
jgi:hypothetical protein